MAICPVLLGPWDFVGTEVGGRAASSNPGRDLRETGFRRQQGGPLRGRASSLVWFQYSLLSFSASISGTQAPRYFLACAVSRGRDPTTSILVHPPVRLHSCVRGPAGVQKSAGLRSFLCVEVAFTQAEMLFRGLSPPVWKEGQTSRPWHGPPEHLADI